jgi:hypothetical protein
MAADMAADEELIPKAEFIEDVGAFLSTKQVDTVLADFQERLRKFRLVEQQLFRQKARLMGKLPEIQKALDIVNKLIASADQGEDLVADFELADGVFAKARVSKAQVDRRRPTWACTASRSSQVLLERVCVCV